MPVKPITRSVFLSTPSARRATIWFGFVTPSIPHFYPRPPRGGRPVLLGIRHLRMDISIHALREEGDSNCRTIFVMSRNFYPRPPRGGRLAQPGTQRNRHLHFYPRPPRGGRRCSNVDPESTDRFLSTPSARRATSFWDGVGTTFSISIHALREEGDGAVFDRKQGGRGISIHALREEGDVSFEGTDEVAVIFLSTPSARRATILASYIRSLLRISIHALREEGDDNHLSGYVGREDFYPRPPRGGRRHPPTTKHIKQAFLSTPSARRATAKRPEWITHRGNFYPRPPRGGRLSTS